MKAINCLSRDYNNFWVRFFWRASYKFSSPPPPSHNIRMRLTHLEVGNITGNNIVYRKGTSQNAAALATWLNRRACSVFLLSSLRSSLSVLQHFTCALQDTRWPLLCLEHHRSVELSGKVRRNTQWLGDIFRPQMVLTFRRSHRWRPRYFRFRLRQFYTRG